MAYLRLAVRGDDEQAVGRAFSGAVVETSLSSYPGTFFTSAPSGAQGVARYWPTTVAASAVTPRVECEGIVVPPTPRRRRPRHSSELPEPDAGVAAGAVARGDVGRPDPGAARGPARRALGRQGRRRQHRRLGRRGRRGHVAAVGLHDRGPAGAPPRAGPVRGHRHPLPNLRAVNFVVHGILGWGVASNLRLDTQAKGLGELLRSRAIDVPAALVASGKPAQRLAARPRRRARPRLSDTAGGSEPHLAG